MRSAQRDRRVGGRDGVDGGFLVGLGGLAPSFPFSQALLSSPSSRAPLSRRPVSPAPRLRNSAPQDIPAGPRRASFPTSCYRPSLTNRDDGATVLSPEELERYARHIVLREVGGPGQAALKNARVLVIGAGGLGAPVLMYLAAAGVGTLGVIDDDAVSLSNLQRQIIHATDDIGEPKVASAAAAIGAAQSACGGRNAYGAAHRGERARSRRALRHRRRRLGQFRNALSGVGRVLPGEEAAGDRDARRVRRHAHDDPGARARTRRQAQSDLSLPVSGRAAARSDPGVLGGRHSRRAHRRARLDDGAGGDPRDRRLRRPAWSGAL